jgi:hypothetical protein
MKAIVENKTMQKFHLILMVCTVALFAFADVAWAMPEVEEVIGQLQQIVEDDPDPAVVDKAEDILAKVLTAHYELTKIPPDYQAAVGNIEGAVGDLEAAVDDGLLDAEQGTELMNLLTCAAWQLAAGAVYQAIDCDADADKIADAEQALAEAQGLWLDGAYKDAANKFKDALAKAEGAVSDPIDPLAGLVTQDLASEDGQAVGKGLLHYDENMNETDIELNCWGLQPGDYTVLLCDCEFLECNPIGTLIPGQNGNAHLKVSHPENVSEMCLLVAEGHLASDKIYTLTSDAEGGKCVEVFPSVEPSDEWGDTILLPWPCE